MNTCNTCLYYVFGRCHRFPPSVCADVYTDHNDDSMMTDFVTRWPQPNREDFCGEYKQSENRPF